ncbi:N-acetylgalactosamine-6-phosphate deacetylase [Volucribacter psittacicida]|uniref:N-acetylgalactosamine-6-phosphate deacetylase n=1 Tax=Volucribacter psittacicida TaxID=203482 RepID=A0A4R1FLH3_9PAST|nr:N-acetylglucosamine-6-phosphate deacetylase [Volucribacter psittacicida]TCJ95866.1 N-acetylgalactosamine-6-phosphate deacetylase [Volucribacter psittacicida]
MRYAIQAKKIITATAELNDKVLVIEQGKISQICDQLPPDCEHIIIKQGYVSAGFIDVHIHGRAGADVMDDDPNAIATIAKTLPQTGVTGWVGTTVSAPLNYIYASMQRMKAYIDAPQQGAELLGSFMEGPYFTERHRGSHPTKYLLSPTIEQLEQLVQAAGGTLLRVAIAPEIDNAHQAIDWLVARGIKVVVAHTNASYEQVAEACRRGADSAAHLFNGMSALHHREPGCCGATLYHDMLAEIIADGIHVHPVVLNLAYRMKSYKKIMLITDCMRAGGLPDGEYTLGIQTVRVSNGQARTFDGSLAGSTCSLDQALRNMVFKANVPVWEAVQMMTYVPAKYLGLDQRIGHIAEGLTANLTVLDDDLQVKATMINGQWLYNQL